MNITSISILIPANSASYIPTYPSSNAVVTLLFSTCEYFMLLIRVSQPDGVHNESGPATLLHTNRNESTSLNFSTVDENLNTCPIAYSTKTQHRDVLLRQIDRESFYHQSSDHPFFTHTIQKQNTRHETRDTSKLTEKLTTATRTRINDCSILITSDYLPIRYK